MPTRSFVRAGGIVLLGALLSAAGAFAADYEVGPGRANTELDTVPWATLAAGDRVLVHYRIAPYRTKFVICRQGTQSLPISVVGVPDGSGALPVVSGENAATPSPLNYWNEDRGVIKIGGANTPADCTPSWIVLENLSIRSARPGFTYTGDDAAVHAYVSNAAAVYVEKGTNVAIRNCELHDCGNGLFAASGTTDLVVEGCSIHDNGIESSIYEHNNYTEANGITFQWNRFGPLRANCPGNNLKDRSAGCVIRYNWIEGGNRQLDLVDSGTLNGDAKYAATFVYGNVLIEPDGAGNSQIVHYGGDSGTTAQYRKGTLHFYDNTVVSTRVGNTTLFRLSTNDEACECRNNVFYVTETGDRLALLNAEGVLNLRNCWFKPGYVSSHSGLTGTINDGGGHVTGTEPGFLDFAGQDFRISETSACRG
ncbi:MAG: right-handed parallel beta-helix repeat-containing protein, partial [Planctomycetes bacterium]|nr:right-handed parallel beta-helix repeat-containing protein [Planctomycetota bacterium]